MVNFIKYHGLGNDFIILDNRDGRLFLTEEDITKMCNRNYGIGADGVVFCENSVIADIKMVIYNSDGSRADMCGNAMRCFAKYVHDYGIAVDTAIKVETGAGIIFAEVKAKAGKADTIKVNMGKPQLDPSLIPCTIEGDCIINKSIKAEGKNFNITSLLMGVPHTVIFDEDFNDEYIIKNGSLIERAKFFPNGTNVNFVKIENENEILVRTWERGAGYTQACGTGASASVVAGVLNGFLNREVLVHLRGGDLIITWDCDGNVLMEGTAEEVFKGEYLLL